MVLIVATLGLVSVTALNMYGGSLTLISAIDSLRKIRPTLRLRIATVGFTALLSLIGALAATKNFLGNFNNFLLLILYLFIPWTAVKTLYEGAAAKALDGADISFFIGLPVTGVLYYFFCRSVDVAAETRVAEAEAAALEEAL